MAWQKLSMSTHDSLNRDFHLAHCQRVWLQRYEDFQFLQRPVLLAALAPFPLGIQIVTGSRPWPSRSALSCTFI